MEPMSDALMFDLLDWISSRPRTYAETMDAWRSNCPRLLVWEDALLAGLVRVASSRVELTPVGEAALEARKVEPAPVVY
jgi:hypothetical protein